MKCLSVKNPLSYLICAGVKDIESRTWKVNYRGKLLIHSCGDFKTFEIQKEDLPKSILDECRNYYKIGKTNNVYVKKLIEFYNNILLPYYNLKTLEDFEKLRNKTTKKEFKPFFLNMAIIGEVELVNIVIDSNSPFAEKGQYQWVLKNAKLYKKPIEQVKGKLNLWNYERN